MPTVSKPPIRRKSHGRSSRHRKPKVLKNPRIAADTPTMLIDDRAGSKTLMEYSPCREVGILCRLESGDVSMVGNGQHGRIVIGVEVKSIFDLVSSMNTGRIQASQIPLMLRTYDRTYLLYYGTYTAGPHGELQIGGRPYMIGSRAVPYGWLEGALMTYQACGVTIKRVTDISEAAQWLGTLARWWAKPWDKHDGMKAFDTSQDISLMPNVPDSVLFRARVAAAIPVIGYKRGLAVARHFPSIRAMVDADEREWMKIEGVGKTIARTAVHFLVSENLEMSVT